MFNITPVHLHLLINHTPVMGGMAAVLLLIYGMIRKTAELERTALLTFVLTALLAIAADSTGGGAAKVAGSIPGIVRTDIRAHSRSADTAKLVAMAAGVFGLIGLILAYRRKDKTAESNPELYIRWHKSPPRWAVVVCLLLGLADIYFMSITAYTGGEIRHPEIRSGYEAPVAPAPATPK
jgi:hypothetical protein